MPDMPANVRLMDLKERGQEARKMLRERFPGVRFSVTIERHSLGGGCIRVMWVDWPHKDAVLSVIRPLESIHRDGYGDILGGPNIFVQAQRANRCPMCGGPPDHFTSDCEGRHEVDA